jgi:hypothetical protein
MREGPLQAEPHGLVVGRGQLVGRRHQRGRKADPRREAADAGDDIARQHRLLVVKAQPVAQPQIPGQAVIVDLVAGDHLRLGLPVGVDAVERVEDEIGIVAGRPVEGDDRIEHGEIRGRHEAQDFRGVGARDARRGKGRSECGGGCKTGVQKIAAAHR